MVKVIFVRKWSFKLVKNDPNKCLYIFGDNDVKKGLGGQAVIRDLPNAWGIPTKKFPNFNPKSYYYDSEYETNCRNIQNALDSIKAEVKKEFYKYLVLPEDGFGTGLAKLPKKAPKTFNYLVQGIYDLIEEIDPKALKQLEKLKGYQAKCEK